MPVPKVRPAILPCVEEVGREVGFVVNEVELVAGRFGGEESTLNVDPDIVEFSAGIRTIRLSSWFCKNASIDAGAERPLLPLPLLPLLSVTGSCQSQFRKNNLSSLLLDNRISPSQPINERFV